MTPATATRTSRPASKAAAKPIPAPKSSSSPSHKPAALPAFLREPAAPRPGQPLDSALRTQFEARFQHDLSVVRVHPNSVSTLSPTARAAAVGDDLYFAPGAYAPHSAEGRELIAHELTHVLQQRADPNPAPSSPTTGNPLHATELEARANAHAVTRSTAALPVTHRAPTGATQFDDDSPGLITRAIEHFFPEIKPILELGFFEWLKQKIVTAVQGLVDTLLAPVRAVTGAVRSLTAHFAQLAAFIRRAAASIARGDCSVLHEAVDAIEQTVSGLVSPVLDTIKSVAGKIGSFFSGLWERFGAPIWHMMERIGGAAWEKIKGFADWLWDKTASLRRWAGAAWRWIKRKLGIGDESPEGSGLLGWLQQKAQSAWDWLKEKLEPVKKPLMVIGGILIMLSPAGPVIAIGAAVVGVIEGVRAIRRYFGNRSGVVSAREILRHTVLPALIRVIKGFAATLADKARGVVGVIRRARDTVRNAAAAAADFSFLAGILTFIADRIDDFAQWGDSLVNDFLGWVDRTTAGFAGFLDRVLNALDAIAAAIHDLIKLPFLLMGKLWNAIPACVRDPFVDFFGQQILGRIPIFATIAGTPEAWSKTKAQVGLIIHQIFIDFDLIGAMKTAFRLLLRVLNVPAELLAVVLAKFASAWETIREKPVDFLKNLFRTLKLALSGFFKRILLHLGHGITGWLTAQLSGTGVTLPTNWRDPGQIFGFLASILGLSLDHIFERMALKLDPETVRRLRARVNMVTGAWEWIKLILTGNWTALWEKIKEKVNSLVSMVLDTVVQWIVTNVVQAIAMQLIATADPTGISEAVMFLIDTYRTIKTVVQYMRQILTMVNTMLDAVLGIAAGVLQPAADLVETAMDRGMPAVIGFLVNLAGMGSVGDDIREALGAIRARVDIGIDWLIEKGRGALEFMGGPIGGPARDDQVGQEIDWVAEEEPHRMWIEEHNGVPVVMMASETLPVPQQLNKYVQQAAALPPPKQQLVQQHAVAANTAYADLFSKVTALVAAKNANSPNVPTLEAAVVSAETALVARIKDIELALGLTGNFGAEENPIPLDWPKPRLTAYPPIYIGPGPLKQDPPPAVDQDLLRAGDIAGIQAAIGPKEKWDPVAQPIRTFFPYNANQTLPGGGEAIGVRADRQLDIGMKLKITEAGATGGGTKINRALRPYGYKSKGEYLDGDHILERQFGGEDELYNLWPLDASLNRGGGSTLAQMTFDVPAEKKLVPWIKAAPAPTTIAVPQLKSQISPAHPLWFSIKSTNG